MRRGPGARRGGLIAASPVVVPKSFLTASWEGLLLLNYACPPELLAPLVPAGTRLDPWKGETLVSLVGFMFRDTKVLGGSIPFHETFEEVNLRFYVVRETSEGPRRAVVFIRELVPRPAIALVARLLYGEPYLAVPMSHDTRLDPTSGGSAEYRWSYRGRDFAMRGEATGPASRPAARSEAEFITEHYWGYTRGKTGDTTEYRVEHDPWDVWDAQTTAFSGDAEPLYGGRFAELLSGPPRSAFIAVGGPVTVYRGQPIDA